MPCSPPFTPTSPGRPVAPTPLGRYHYPTTPAYPLPGCPRPRRSALPSVSPPPHCAPLPVALLPRRATARRRRRSVTPLPRLSHRPASDRPPAYRPASDRPPACHLVGPPPHRPASATACRSTALRSPSSSTATADHHRRRPPTTVLDRHRPLAARIERTGGERIKAVGKKARCVALGNGVWYVGRNSAQPTPL